MPASLQADFQGTAASFRNSLSNEPLLILAALITVYIVLGVLYESFIHPITILSTLPSAGVGAFLALILFHQSLSIVAIIGLVLLIGIVEKNGIMMVDFALEMEREHGKSATEAIYQACLLRFRPIMMTTMAALLAGVPLAFGTGEGSELRKPLGIAMVGGPQVSPAGDTVVLTAIPFWLVMNHVFASTGFTIFVILGLAMLAFLANIGLSGGIHSVIIAHVVICAPFAMAIIRLRLSQMDAALEPAAWNLGATQWGAMRHVVIPFCLPSILAALFITMAVSSDEFAVAWFVSGLNETLPVKVLGFLQGQVSPRINAIGSIVFTITMTLVILAQAILLLRRPARAPD